MSDENDPISKLLRLKRFEQPPEGYFDGFLKEFQERQRRELLRRPAWRIALDRLEARLESFSAQWSFARLSYAGASAAVLLAAGLFTLNLLQHPGQSGLEGLASNGGGSGGGAFHLAATPVSAPAGSGHAALTLNSEMSFPDVLPAESTHPTASQHHPRYILDSRPVSYEPPFRF